MPYPNPPKSGKHLFSCLLLLLMVIGARASHICPILTLYKRDTSLELKHSGIVKNERNGDIRIMVPASASGRYKIRFFDETNALLFEIRQIRDPLLIVEKYNFGHAGIFQYELYRDNSLVERNRFRIGSD